MCGIAAILNLSSTRPIRVDDLRPMADALRHRGPDSAGYCVDPQGRCGLAFRRLAIIDLKTGDQPIGNEDGSVQLVFNGEVYNYRELRRELQDAGHRFRTQSDSEVIVHAYEQWGERCLQRLAGMFAILLWDGAAGRLLAARDRLGKKPLVFAEFDGRVYFASEAKAILELGGAPREIDPQSLHRYLLFQYVPAPFSIFRGFHKLSPGHVMSWPAGKRDHPPQRVWWQPPLVPPGAAGENVDRSERAYAAARAELGRLLTRAVERRLISDVPLGAFLSGGIDSSIVVGLMRKLGVSPLRTFSIGFDDPRYDESAHARKVSAHFLSEHHAQIVTPQARQILETLAYHYDEPLGDSSAIPTYYVSRYARSGVTVALTGDGGDECFGGYDRYRAALLAASTDAVPRPLRAVAAGVSRALPRGQAKSLGNRAFRFLSTLGQPAARRYLSWINVFTPDDLADGYTPDFAARIDAEEPVRWFTDMHDAGGGDVLRRAIRTDLLTYLPYDLLVKVDIASMACSLECRSPFLDHELVEFAAGLPREWLIRGRRGKQILRDWAGDLLPPEILERPKTGFGVPVGEWFRAELKDELREALLSDAAISGRIFRRSWLESRISAHLAQRENHEHSLWSLLILEHWARRWRPCGI